MIWTFYLLECRVSKILEYSEYSWYKYLVAYEIEYLGKPQCFFIGRTTKRGGRGVKAEKNVITKLEGGP